MLEAGVGPAVSDRESGPELDPMEARRVIRRRFLGVGDAATGGHEVELPRPNRLPVAEAVAVQHLALNEPGDRLQADVRMRWHPHARAPRDVVRPEVIDEAPCADRRAQGRREEPENPGALAQVDLAPGQQFLHRAFLGRPALLGEGGRRCSLQVAHRLTVRLP